MDKTAESVLGILNRITPVETTVTDRFDGPDICLLEFRNVDELRPWVALTNTIRNLKGKRIKDCEWVVVNDRIGPQDEIAFLRIYVE